MQVGKGARFVARFVEAYQKPDNLSRTPLLTHPNVSKLLQSKTETTSVAELTRACPKACWEVVGQEQYGEYLETLGCGALSSKVPLTPKGGRQ